MFSHRLSYGFIYYSFHTSFSFIYFLSFLCTILCTFYILYSCTVLILFLISIFRYYSFPILFSCYTFHSSLSYLYYRIRSCSMLSSCTFHILLSCTIHILHIHLYFYILSVLFLCLYTYFHIKLYCTSCSCNCLYFHRIARLCFSYHIISYHILFIYISSVYTFPFLLCSCLRIP